MRVGVAHEHGLGAAARAGQGVKLALSFQLEESNPVFHVASAGHDDAPW